MDADICQSCGLPMPEADQHGTNADGSLSREYCVYCFKKGDFLHEYELHQMIEINLQYLDDFNALAGTHYTQREARECMKKSMPLLKRWR